MEIEQKPELHLRDLASAKSDEDLVEMLAGLYTKLTGKTPSASEVAEALDHYKASVEESKVE